MINMIEKFVMSPVEMKRVLTNPESGLPNVVFQVKYVGKANQAGHEISSAGLVYFVVDDSPERMAVAIYEYAVMPDIGKLFAHKLGEE